MTTSSQTYQITVAVSQSEETKYWKDVGYRGFSAFLASDDDFLIFRRFGALNARLLLYLQDEIVVLEEQLRRLEEKHAHPTAADIHNGSFRQEALPERKALLDTISKKVREYSKLLNAHQATEQSAYQNPDELLIQHSALRSRPPVHKRYMRSIANWFFNQDGAILAEETAYIDKPNDLIQLVPKSRTPLRGLLEKSSRFRLSRLWAAKNPPLPQHSAHPEEIHYSSDTKIDNSIGITITILGMLMLIVPLWVLNETNGTRTRLGVITGFIVLFLGLIAFTTVARPFESLAAAAAYSAVLVVFLQSA
jgi:hypothetical protein